MTDRPYSMTSYDGYITTPKDPNFDWRVRNGDTLQDLELTVHATSGLDAMLALMRAIEDGRLEGRQLDWGASRSWYLVAIET